MRIFKFALVISDRDAAVGVLGELIDAVAAVNPTGVDVLVFLCFDRSNRRFIFHEGDAVESELTFGVLSSRSREQKQSVDFLQRFLGHGSDNHFHRLLGSVKIDVFLDILPFGFNLEHHFLARLAGDFDYDFSETADVANDRRFRKRPFIIILIIFDDIVFDRVDAVATVVPIFNRECLGFAVINVLDDARIPFFDHESFDDFERTAARVLASMRKDEDGLDGVLFFGGQIGNVDGNVLLFARQYDSGFNPVLCFQYEGHPLGAFNLGNDVIEFFKFAFDQSLNASPLDSAAFLINGHLRDCSFHFNRVNFLFGNMSFPITIEIESLRSAVIFVHVFADVIKTGADYVIGGFGVIELEFGDFHIPGLVFLAGIGINFDSLQGFHELSFRNQTPFIASFISWDIQSHFFGFFGTDEFDFNPARALERDYKFFHAGEILFYLRTFQISILVFALGIGENKLFFRVGGYIINSVSAIFPPSQGIEFGQILFASD